MSFITAMEEIQTGENKIAFDINQGITIHNKLQEVLMIAFNLFEWQGLPYGLSSQKIEQLLLKHGSLSAFNAYEGFFILPYAAQGVDMYDNPIGVQPVYNGQLRINPVDNAPRILRDNLLMRPLLGPITNYISRMLEIQKSIAIIERHLRIPFIIKANEDNRDSLERFYTKAYSSGTPVIFTDDAFPLDNIGILGQGLQSGQALEQLWQDYYRVEGELYTLLGVLFNPNAGKASGIGVSETMSEMQSTYAVLDSRLKQREDFCARINEEFKMQITVSENLSYQRTLAKQLAVMSAQTNLGQMAIQQQQMAGLGEEEPSGE